MAAAHDRAVETAMAYAEEHIGYTRTGYHGRTQDGRSVGRYEAGEGLIWTGWKHSTNRESEPQLHTHVAVLNRLRTLSDGVIRALDGRGIRPVKEAIATAYDRALEEELVASPGGGDGRPPGREGPRDRRGGPGAVRGRVHPPRADPGQGRGVDRPVRGPERARARRGRAQGDPDRCGVGHPQAQGGGGRAGGGGRVGAGTAERAAKLVATLEAVADAAEAAATAGHPDRGGRVCGWTRPCPSSGAALLAAAVADVQHEYATWTVGNLVAAIDRRIGPLPAEAGGAGPARCIWRRWRGRRSAPGNAYGVVLLTAPDPVRGAGGAAPPAGRALDFPAAHR